MAAGYSANPLFKKLGLKDGFSVKLVNPPVNYKKLIGDISNQITFADNAAADLDFVHFFTNSQTEFENVLPKIKEKIKKDGTIWVSWYKKSSGKVTELTENMIRDTALATGLVDVKVCAVDDDWSGLKLDFRLKDR